MRRRDAVLSTAFLLVSAAIGFTLLVAVMSIVDAGLEVMTGVERLGSWVLLGAFSGWVAVSHYRKVRKQ